MQQKEKNNAVFKQFDNVKNHYEVVLAPENSEGKGIAPIKSKQNSIQEFTNDLAEILFAPLYIVELLINSS